jgi:2-aminoethylphosphonate-pyruvate transaminase
MKKLGFRCLLPDKCQSPIITAFYSPESAAYSFNHFYARIKERGFVIYPGKVTDLDTFRIGNIGDVHPADMENLLDSIAQAIDW